MLSQPQVVAGIIHGSHTQMFFIQQCQVGNVGHGGRNLVCLGTRKAGSALPRVGPQGQAGRQVDHWFSADPTGAPAILQVDTRPQAILKLRPHNSLDYKVRQPRSYRFDLSLTEIDTENIKQCRFNIVKFFLVSTKDLLHFFDHQCQRIFSSPGQSF